MPLIQAARTDPEYGFDITDQNGHTIRMDIPVDQGGGGTGFRPMQTLLAALCACSGVDIVGILKKQRQELTGLEMYVDGERAGEAGSEIALWKTVDLEFRLTGALEPAKAWRAVDLSIGKYCSVAETLRRAGAEITWRLSVNGEEVQNS
jgi:putative redox protein